MDNKCFETLLITSATADASSICLINSQTFSIIWTFKGAELQVLAPQKAIVVRNAFLLVPTCTKPTLLTLGFESRSRLCQRSILPGCLRDITATQCGSFVCGAIDERLYFWHLGTGQLLTVVNAHYQNVTVVRFSTCGSFLISGGADGLVQVWNTASVLAHSEPSFGTLEPQAKWFAHALPVSDLYVSQSRVYTSSSDHTCKIFALFSNELLLTFICDRPLSSVVVDSAECRIFLGTTGGLICGVNLFDDKLMGSLKQQVNLCTAANTDQCQLFEGHEASVLCLSINLDGCLLASGSEDRTARLWHIESRQCLKVFDAFKGPITTAHFMRSPTFLPVNIPVQPLRKQVEAEFTSVPLSLQGSGNCSVTRQSDRMWPTPGKGLHAESQPDQGDVKKEMAHLKLTNRLIYTHAVNELLRHP